ncbi:DUF3098 domain-containing protein [Sphingobacterium sp. LRF_L2]|uniref:DUF3098 domain-containing protein n=1 Tax=Sphingobacterium sp. LRF_L2 TaxID=3369421 RepID=UPI003F5F7E47
MSEKQHKSSSLRNEPKAGFAFEKINYQIFIASIATVVLGFILMMGTEDIYSFTKITLAPLVVIIGFALGFVAILYKPKKKNN